jgi:hypothetical protein
MVEFLKSLPILNSGILVPVAMLGWIPFVLALFWFLPARRAVVAGFVLGWLFLPIVSYRIEGLPDFHKTSAVNFGVLAGVLLFDRRRLTSLRPLWWDAPVLVLCGSPFVTSVSNELGMYDGLSAAFSNVTVWGIPYVLGRAYFADIEGLRELALGIVVGGLVYVPLCLFEIRMSPQLHIIVYGYHQHSFSQTIRFGGWRPTVFMQHGLMVSVWMMSATIVAGWLWATGAVRRLGGMPMWLWVGVLLVTTVLTKSVNGWALLTLGMGVLGLIYRFGTWLPVFLLLVASPGYVAMRATQAWDGAAVLPAIKAVVGEDRTSSVASRLKSENLMVEKAHQRPWWGWGRWGRSRVYSEQGRDMTVTDSLWVIALGDNGAIGLTALMALQVVGVAALWLRCPVARWLQPEVAAAAILAVVVALYAIDSCVNAMVNPIYTLAIGGLVGATVLARRFQTGAMPMR